MSNGNESAYPQQLVEDRHGDLQPASAFYDVGGLTKREAFAMAVMQGMLAAGNGWPNDREAPELARRAVHSADALLAALSGSPTQ